MNNQGVVDLPVTPDVTAESKGSDHVAKTIDDVLRLESLESTPSERIAERIAAFTGSMFFIWLHVVWFALWMIFNIRWPWIHFQPVDPFPFTFLTMVVSLEAIFLSAFILMSENRQGRLGDRRSRVNLQVDMIAEREITKLMEVLVEVRDHLGVHRRIDPELDNMQRATNIEHLTEAAESVDNSHDKSKQLSKSEDASKSR